MEKLIIAKVKEYTGVEITEIEAYCLKSLIESSYEKCPDCGGGGTVDQGGGYIEDCYKCRGSGQIEKEEA